MFKSSLLFNLLGKYLVLKMVVGMHAVMMMFVEKCRLLVLARFGDDLIASIVSRSVIILFQLLSDIASTLMRWS